MYLVAATLENGTYFHRLHKIDLTTGQDQADSPVVITASVPGTSVDSVNGVITFNPSIEHNRSGLLLQNGLVYIAYATNDETNPAHGWLFGYNANTLQQVAVYNSTPDDVYGDFWGGAPAADASGNIYTMTGNGLFDLDSGGRNTGDSFLKFTSSNGNALSLSDYFTPFNQACLRAHDWDLGSGGILLLPDQPGPHPHLMFSGGKEGRLYLVDRDNLGQFTPIGDSINPCDNQDHTDIDAVVQESSPNSDSPIFGTPAYWQASDGSQYIYVAPQVSNLAAYKLSGGLLSDAPVTLSPEVLQHQGAIPSVSSNGNLDATGIVWLYAGSPACADTEYSCFDQSPGVLRAYSATNISNELYNSEQNAARDRPSNSYVHFALPTVAGGKVFIGAYHSVEVYGLLGSVNLLSSTPTPLNFTLPGGKELSDPAAITLTTQTGTINWSSTISYSTGASAWLNLSAITGTITHFNSSLITATTNTNGLAAGIYTATITFSDSANSFNTTTSTVVLNLSNYTYYLPFLANDANNYSSYLAFQNIGTSGVANIDLRYYTAQGTFFASDTSCTSLNNKAECLPPNPFGQGKQGVGVINSNQPLAVIVAVSTPFGGSAYAVGSGSSSQLSAPLAFHDAYGDFSTQLTVFNGASSATTAIVQFYDTAGNLQGAATQTLNLSGLSGQTLDQAQTSSNLPKGFNGWAKITGPTGSQLVAQVLEQSPTQKFVALVAAQTQSQTKLYAPAIFKGAFGFNTGANIINPNSQAVSITVTYYDVTGSPLATTPFTLNGNSVQGIFQGSNSGGLGLPAGSGLPAGFTGAAIITSSIAGVIMVVNESGGLSNTGTSLSGIYASSASGNTKVSLPVMANGGFGYVTGATIFNTSSTTISGTIQYYDVSGNPVGIAQTFSMGPYASQLAYQGTPNLLPEGFYGTAVITQTTPNHNVATTGLLVTTNALSGLFYSYVEPNP